MAYELTGDLAVDIKNNNGLIYKMAIGCYKRLVALGVSADLEDVYQDMAETFIIAADKFNPEYGFAFSTYFVHSARNNFGRKYKSVIKERDSSCDFKVYSIEEMNKSWSENGDELNMYDVISRDDTTPESLLVFKQTLDKYESRLSPLARVIIDFIIEPPDALVKEFEAKRAHNLAIRDSGVESRERPDINMSVVIDFLQMVSEDEAIAKHLRKARAEITNMVKELRC